MLRFTTKILFPIAFWAITMGYPTLLKSQEVKSFSGKLEIGSYQGEARYSYRLMEGDTLLDGPFHMQSSNLDALLKDGDETFVFDGSFKEGDADGFWRFEFGSFTSDGNTRLIDGQYRLNVNGVQFEAYGVINRGKPNGQWILMVNELKNSSIQRTLFRSAISFENGIPQKNIRIENENSTLVGRFLRNGLAHDVWSRYAKDDTDTSESWFFEEGLLTKVTYETDESSFESRIFQASAEQTKIIPLNKEYIDLLNLISEENIGTPDENNTSSLLEQNYDHYQKITEVLSFLGKSSFMPEFKVKAPYFSKDSSDIKRLDVIADLYQKTAPTSELLLNSTQLQIMKRSDSEIDFLLGALQQIVGDLLQPLKQLTEYHKSGITEFLSPELLLKRFLPDDRPTTNIRVQMERNGDSYEQTFVGPDAENYDFKRKTMAVFEEMARYAYGSVDSIANVLNKKLASEQKQQELVAIEKRLIAQIEQLSRKVDSANNVVPNNVAKTLLTIKEFGENELNTYTLVEDNSSKSEKGKQLVKCLDDLNLLAIAVSNLPNRQQQLKEAYVDAVWNPFMATIMNEAVKKRITNAYENVLAPYILSSIQSHLSCDNAEYFNQLLEQIHERMFELREENTVKLERKLKRERDPEVILGLFNIQTKK